MTLSRRDFLGVSGAAATTVLVGAGAQAATKGKAGTAPGLSRTLGSPRDRRALERVGGAALETAKSLGASFADVRMVSLRNQHINSREDHIAGISDSESFGVGVRALVDGTWGFSATYEVSEAGAARAAKQACVVAKANRVARGEPVTLAPTPSAVDVWRTPLTKDPFRISLEQKADLLLATNAAAMKVAGVKFISHGFHFVNEWKLYMNSEGSILEQDLHRTRPSYDITAVGDDGDFETRASDGAPTQQGWEYIEALRLPESARRHAEEAVTKLKATPVSEGPRDIILHPTNLWLTIHESVGHPTELDRALGYEANFAGTSFATVDKLRKLRYGSRLVNLVADRTVPTGLATCGYDDDGVKTTEWDIVRDGTFVGYQTTREQASWIGEEASRGCSYGDSWSTVAFQRMPNLHLEPGPERLSLDDLIADTDDGVYVMGRGSWSIDQQRYNFQFSGQFYWEIKKGKLIRPLRHVAYQSNSVEFWNACDAICDRRHWMLGGSFYDGKGEPGQSNGVSHGCAPSRFRKINVLRSRKS